MTLVERIKNSRIPGGDTLKAIKSTWSISQCPTQPQANTAPLSAEQAEPEPSLTFSTLTGHVTSQTQTPHLFQPHQLYHFHNADKVAATIRVIDHERRERTILPNSPLGQGKLVSRFVFMLLQLESKVGNEILIKKWFSKTNVYFSGRDNKYSECRTLSKLYHKGLSQV